MKEYTILLDSSVADLSVGIAKGNTIVSETRYEAWQKQSEYMVDELGKLMDSLGITKDDILDVMCSIGPASYTGVRIALTIAKTISLATSCPIYPVSSLEVLKDHDKPSICLINARSGFSYFNVYNSAKVHLNEQITTNDEVLKFINEHPDFVVCGDTKYLDIKGYKGDIIEEMLSLKEVVTPAADTFTLSPVYLKRP